MTTSGLAAPAVNEENAAITLPLDYTCKPAVPLNTAFATGVGRRK